MDLASRLKYSFQDKTAYDDGWNISGQQKLCTAAAGGKEPTGEASTDCNRIRDFFGMAIIFLGFFITGIGTSFFYSFGIPYIGAILSISNEP